MARVMLLVFVMACGGEAVRQTDYLSEPVDAGVVASWTRPPDSLEAACASVCDRAVHVEVQYVGPVPRCECTCSNAARLYFTLDLSLGGFLDAHQFWLRMCPPP